MSLLLLLPPLPRRGICLGVLWGLQGSNHGSNHGSNGSHRRISSSACALATPRKKTLKGHPTPLQSTPFLGRPSNNLRMGIVGLPNVGKSCIFNAVTDSNVASENYPFCTIDPTEARVAVPDPRFDWLCKLYDPSLKVPAFLTVIDIAGLVKGASDGQGLGNAFLSHIRAVDGIFHLVRCFHDPSVTHVEGGIDPVRDLEIIHEELRLKDQDFLSKTIERERKSMRGGAIDKAKLAELIITETLLSWISSGKDVRSGTWEAAQIDTINLFSLITAKSVVYLANCSPGDHKDPNNKHILDIQAWIDKNHPGDILIPFSGLEEETLAAGLESKDPPSRRDSSMISEIVVTGYKALDLINFFTCGPQQVRAWTIRRGTKAPQAAGVIHSDFEKSFICAESMSYSALHACGSESAVRTAGQYLQKGRDYVVEDGDILYFKAGQQSKAKKGGVK